MSTVSENDLPLRFESGRQIGHATVTHTDEGMDVRFTLADSADIALTNSHAFVVKEGFVDLVRVAS